MAFRAEEAAQDGYESARRYLVQSSGVESDQREAADFALLDLINKYGPVVRRYPTWHPLVPQLDPTQPESYPSGRSGYAGVDHTVYLAHAFISCPYDGGEALLKSVKAMHVHPCAEITAERIDAQFYNIAATPVLVRCEWRDKFQEPYMVPTKLAVPLMIQEEMRIWPSAKLAERWETMRPYILGVPHGARSSLFVTQETAIAMKRAYMAMVESGMFGPLKY